MSEIKSYRDLIVWQKSIRLVKNIYVATKSFPKEELYGLTNQLKRCAVSIPSNIAEGYGRNSTGDYKRFLHVAVGSLYELQTQIETSFQLKYLDKANFESITVLCTEIDKMLYALIQKVK